MMAETKNEITHISYVRTTSVMCGQLSLRVGHFRYVWATSVMCGPLFFTRWPTDIFIDRRPDRGQIIDLFPANLTQES